MARCILDPVKICNHCGLCDDRCELNPHKICDNCFQCLETDTRDYAEIEITDILTELDETAFEPADLAVDWEPTCYRVGTMPGVKGSYKKKED